MCTECAIATLNIPSNSLWSLSSQSSFHWDHNVRSTSISQGYACFGPCSLLDWQQLPLELTGSSDQRFQLHGNLSTRLHRLSQPTHRPQLTLCKEQRVTHIHHCICFVLNSLSALPGHPKTLRDLSQPNEMLSLPAAFGSIFLGETFESYAIYLFPLRPLT